SVCVLGAGLLGLTVAAMASIAGAAQIISVDIDMARRERARSFGATHVVSPEELVALVEQATDHHGVDTVFELSGSNAAFEAAWPLVRSGGTIIAVGSVFPSPPVELRLEQLVRRNLILRGIHNYAPHHLLQAVQFLEQWQRQFPFAELVSQWH